MRWDPSQASAEAQRGAETAVTLTGAGAETRGRQLLTGPEHPRGSQESPPSLTLPCARLPRVLGKDRATQVPSRPDLLPSCEGRGHRQGQLRQLEGACSQGHVLPAHRR